MAAIISKLKSGVTGNQSPPPIEGNPIIQYFEVGKECTNAGPGLVWKVHEAHRKSDGKECSVFVFDKRIADKLTKQKRKEVMLDRIRACVGQLEKMRHPRMLQIIHTMEEGTTTIAFAAEAVMSTLHNIMAFHESMSIGPPPVYPYPLTLAPATAQEIQKYMSPPPRPPFAKEYYFLDIELRYGLLQIVEALNYLHYTARHIHRNLCPQVIIVNKRGTWKLFGLEFSESIGGQDPTEMVGATPWSIKVAKICQPNLDYSAPEIQMNGQANILSDMFSLGLLICTLFNGGKSILSSKSNPMLYIKQVECLDHQLSMVLPRIPVALQEAVQRLLSRDPHPRPTTQLLPLIKYFKCACKNGDTSHHIKVVGEDEIQGSDNNNLGRCQNTEVVIHALQYLDAHTSKDALQKGVFYKGVLCDALPYIPKKLRWQHVWPILHVESKIQDLLPYVLTPIIWLTNEATPEEFHEHVMPAVRLFCRNLLTSPKSQQAAVIILENLHFFLRKCKKDELNEELMPLLYAAMDNNNNLIQTASLVGLQNVTEFIQDKHLHQFVLHKLRMVLEKNHGDVKVINLVLGFCEKILPRLDKNRVVDDVIPIVLIMRLGDPHVVSRVVNFYKIIYMEKKFNLTVSVMASKMIPSLAPQTVNKGLNEEQFTNLMQMIYEMLETIDSYQRHRLKTEGVRLPSPERHRSLRHQISTDNLPAPPFNIPNLRVEQRKTSSAEDMARKNSMAQAVPTTSTATASTSSAASAAAAAGTAQLKRIGQWIFGSNNSTNSTNNDNNFLRVSNVFTNRRLSDNTLMTPKIRIAPSCASSPGGTPGGTSGLPTRRHSSIGPQERRGSTVNLSPPTAYQIRGRGGSGSSLSVPATSHCAGGSMPNTSSSVPFLLTSSMQSIRSRRPSACLSGSQGSGILHQLSSGMVRHMPSTHGTHSSHGHHPHQPWNPLQGATAAGYSALQHTAMAVRKCPSLNITLTR